MDKSKAGKLRWQKAEVIGLKLGDVSKYEVMQFLYSEIKERGWLDRAWQGESLILAEIKKLPGWARMIEAREREGHILTHQPGWSSNECRCEGKAPKELMGMAMWFISKCPSIESAERAFRAAVAASQILSEEPSNAS